MTQAGDGAMAGVGRRISRREWLHRLLGGVARHSPGFAVEVLLFFSGILLFQTLGYTALGFTGRATDLSVFPLGLAISALAVGAAEARFGLYRRVWNVAGLPDAIAVAMAVVEASLLAAAANALLPDGDRAFRLLAPLLACPSIAAAVAAYRLWPRLRTDTSRRGNRLLVVTRDATAYGTVKTLAHHPSPDWSPVALVSDDPAELHKTVMGIPVVGLAAELSHWMEVTRADGVAFVGTGQGVAEFRELLGLVLAMQRPILILPGPGEWLNGPAGARLRQLSADDLVGREARLMEIELARESIENRTVLVTGAAGSIGAELTRLVAALRPKRLILVDNNESGLFDIAEELAVDPMVDVRQALISIVDRDHLQRVFAEEAPDVVFHAAAYKHVPMLEAHPEQAVLTNVIGTKNTLDCAAAAGVSQFILVSTDKAVARHSVMGCSKRLCELMVLTHESEMACWAVRFGNVVGSRGSVIPTFERQIQQGGPVTITHPEMERYMMTIREAAALVIASIKLARPRHLYMLDMGEPIKIRNLAMDLIRSRGLRPGADIEIVYTGLRPGERMTEELLADDEGVRPTGHDSIVEVVSPALVDAADLEWVIGRLGQLAGEGRRDELSVAVRRAVRGPLRPRSSVGAARPAAVTVETE